MTLLLDGHPDIAALHSLVQDFSTLLRIRNAAGLGDWIQRAVHAKIPALTSFVAGLGRDHAAVEEAFHSPWSNGQVEGQVHRLKLIKRQMYGRAGFVLLRRRVLPFSVEHQQRIHNTIRFAGDPISKYRNQVCHSDSRLRQRAMKRIGSMVGLIVLAGSASAQSKMQMHEEVGHVHLLTSCSPAAAEYLDRGLGLFYSFWYDEARKSFDRAAASDSRCAMARWGQAITEYQPVETLPEGSQLQAGRNDLAEAKVASEQTPRERDYVHALGIIFDTDARQKAASRAGAYSESMGKLHTTYPHDSTATTLYALSLLSPELPDDPTLARNKVALELLNGVLKKEPDNPGVLHFIIHASDSPALAAYGLDAARRYARIAPASAHALHMPSHIFARLGLWQDDIQSNLASEAAAENQTSGMHTGAQHRLHAMEFLQYAYLQTGQDRKAQAIVEEAETIKASDLEAGFEGYYGWVEASFKVRFALETEDWAAALKLTPDRAAGPYVRRVDYWGQAVAAGHLRDWKAAETALVAYEATFTKPELSEEEAHQSAQPAETRAWAAFASGKPAEAVKILGQAADHQDKVGKGEVELPAREMLADMLRLSNDPKAALTEYQLSLKTDPGRLSCLLHAEETADVLHRHEIVKALAQQVARNIAHADDSVKRKIARTSPAK